METLQFPLGRFRRFCGPEPAASSLAQSSGLYSHCFGLQSHSLSLRCSLLLSLYHGNWLSLSFSHAPEKGWCQCCRLSEWITKNKTSSNNGALSSAQIKRPCCHCTVRLFSNWELKGLLDKGAAAYHGEHNKKYFCKPGIKPAPERFVEEFSWFSLMCETSRRSRGSSLTLFHPVCVSLLWCSDDRLLICFCLSDKQISKSDVISQKVKCE